MVSKKHAVADICQRSKKRLACKQGHILKYFPIVQRTVYVYINFLCFKLLLRCLRKEAIKLFCRVLIPPITNEKSLY